MEGERLDGQDPCGAVIRLLRPEDGARLVEIDRAITGRTRSEWYARKLERALRDSDVTISLGAESDGLLVGALLGSVHYGEFGQPEPVAILDTILVDPRFGRRGIATALVDQLLKNLRGLRLSQLRTEVAWDQWDLTAFLAKRGFRPVPRLVLELDVASDA